MLEGGDTTVWVRVESKLEKARFSPLAEERVHFTSDFSELI